MKNKALILGAVTMLLLVTGRAFAQPEARHEVVALSSDGTMRILEDTTCTGSACRWTDIDRNRNSVALAANSGTLFQLHNTGAIYEWNGQPCTDRGCPSWTRLDNNRATTAIAANSNDLFQLHRTGAIWRWKGAACEGNSCPSWERLDANPATRALAAGGPKLFQLHEGGAIWEWRGQPCEGDRCSSWRRLDANPGTRQIVTTRAGNLYQRHENGSIWRWDGQPCQGNRCASWTRLDNNRATVEIYTADGALYQRHGDGSVWRWLGRACEGDRCPHWERIGRDPATADLAAGPVPVRSDLDPGPAGTPPVYRVKTNGAVERWPGRPCAGADCPAWNDMGGAFTRYSTERGGLYAFGGDLGFTRSTSASASTPEQFGYGTRTFARTPDGKIRMNVLLLLTNYSDTSFDADQDPDFYIDKYFGAQRRLESYFRKNAPDVDLEINLAAVARYQDPRTLPCAHRWEAAEADDDDALRFDRLGCDRDTDGQSFEIATVEALEDLPADVVADLGRYDRNRNGRLEDTELYVIHITASPPAQDGYPYGDNGGLRRTLPRCARLAGIDKEVCGAFLPIGDETNFITVAHEVAHLFGGVDVYGDQSNSYQYTLMSSTITNDEMFFHLDPWHKMVMGFATPLIVPMPSEPTGRRTLRLTYPDNAAAYEPVLFYDPARGRREFFMVEYRAGGISSDDRSVPSSGLVIWYVNTGDSDGGVPAALPDVIPQSERCEIGGAAVAIIGAPNQMFTKGDAWTPDDGVIRLQWPQGSDTGLRLEVKTEPGRPFLEVDWWKERPATLAFRPGRPMTTELGRSRPGNDFCSFELRRGAAPTDCLRACQSERRCVAYDFVTRSGQPAQCFLKHADRPSVAATGIVSGTLSE
jgi:M6 family metalloprotease-like protein